MKVSTWHHAPQHRFVSGQIYIVTARTIRREHFFRGRHRLRLLEDVSLECIVDAGWRLRAWAMFSNHYHWVAYATHLALDLHALIQRIHSESAIAINRLDHAEGRRIWFQYWDTCLTHPTSYYARLNYVNKNAVHHGLVRAASQYPFCSAGWWETHADQAVQRRINSFRCDRISIEDDFEPVWEP